MNQNRISTIIVLSLLVFSQSSTLFLASASEEAGTINNFSTGTASISIPLTANQLDTNYSIDIPRNVTFQSGQFMINARDEVATPGQVSLDIGQDGVNEWAFDGLGFGDLGHQNTFFNNMTSQSIFSSGTAHSAPFYLPYNSAIDTGTMNTTYTSSVPAGLMPIANISAYEIGDVDNDTRDEIVVKASISSSGISGPALATLDWTASTGVTLSSWAATCGEGSDIVVVDVNGDNFSDVISIAPDDDRVCFHQTNPASGALGAASPVSLSSDVISARAGDIDGDGYADILSIHDGGIVSLRKYNDKNSNFDDNATLTIFGNGTTMPTQLTSIYAGHLNGLQGNFSALVADNTGHTSHVKWVNGGLALGAYTFDGMESEIIGGDIDQDGDIDLLSSTMQGYVLAENNGTTWTTTSVISSMILTNATIADYNGDGALSLLVPQFSSSDGNSLTMEGNISIFNISTTSITATQTILEPWSVPTDSKYVDMDSDGLPEHIVSAGEGNTFGLFIGSWNSIAMDIDQNGQNDLFAFGYAGDGQSGTPPLEFEDPLGFIPTLLSPLTGNQMYTSYDYDIKMNHFTYDFTSSGDGTFNISNMDIGYDHDFIVENNPAAVGNFTNIINQQQTAGTGTIQIDLPFLSTKNGTVSLSNLYADYIPGAPNLALPPDPVLQVDILSSEILIFSWQDDIDFGTDLIEFEIFKANSGGIFDLNSPAFVTGINSTSDSDILAGQSYDYAVRSLHLYGVTSNLSARLSITVPFPAPPMAVQGLIVTDTANDNGSSLDVTWNASLDLVSEYRIFVDTKEIPSLQSLTSVSTIALFTNQWSTNITVDGDGNALNDRTDYWVAVVAFDSYGNITTNFSSFGPVQSQNNSLRSAEISFEMTSSGFSNTSWFELSALDSLHLNLTLSSDGEGIPSQDLSLYFISQDYQHPQINGVTDENGTWYAVQVDDLTELSASFAEFIGVVSLVVEYDGTTGSTEIQPADVASATLNGIGILRASISTPPAQLELDESNQYSIAASVTPELPEQNGLLANVVYDWQLFDSAGNLSDSGSVEIKGGEITLDGNATPGDELTFSPSTNQLWFSPTPGTFSFTFVDSLSNETGNETGNETSNETGNDTNQWIFPDVTLAGTVSCESATYAWEDNGADLAIICTITNPNPFEVQIGFSWTNPSATPTPLTFEHQVILLRSDFIIIANGSHALKFTPIRNGPSDGLFPGIQGVGYEFTFTCFDDGADLCSTMTSPSATTEGEIQWTLGEQIEDTTPTETKGGSGALVGGIIAVLVVVGGVVAFVLLRPRSEEDDWYEEFDDDEDDEVPPASPSKPSRNLDEIKSEGGVISTSEPPEERRASLFDEVDGRGEIEHYDQSEDTEPELEHETETENEEVASEDNEITVDDEGTEWWEDEEGVWWYREDGWEDWAVWED